MVVKKKSSGRNIGRCKKIQERIKNKEYSTKVDKHVTDCKRLSPLDAETVCKRGELLFDVNVNTWDMRGVHKYNPIPLKQLPVDKLFKTFHEAKGGIKNKMDQMLSISTNPFENTFCNAMYVMGCYSELDSNAHEIVCGHCYSIQQLTIRGPKTAAPYTHNGKVLASSIMCEGSIPEFLPGEAIRWNANGELLNEIHFANILNISEYNPKTEMVLFTKRHKVCDNVFKCRDKPDNLTIIYSNPYLDAPISFEDHNLDFDSRNLLPSESSYEYIDGIFNVVKNIDRNEYAHLLKEGQTKPVMCAQSCIDCYACYMRKRKFVVVEDLKPGT